MNESESDRSSSVCVSVRCVYEGVVMYEYDVGDEDDVRKKSCVSLYCVELSTWVPDLPQLYLYLHQLT